MTIKKALVVDDSKVCRLSISRLLQEKHIEVDEAESGESALERLEVVRPDVIFMDVFMPGMSGYDAARAIVDNPRSHGIPVVMCTSRNSDNDRALAANAGASGFLVKPATEHGLESVLTALGAGPGAQKLSSSPSGSTRGRSKSSNGAISSNGSQSHAAERAHADELQRAVRSAVEEAQRAAVKSAKEAADEARQAATRSVKAAVDEAAQQVGAQLAREAEEALEQRRAEAVASIDARAAEALAIDGPLMRALETRLVTITEETVARTLEKTLEETVAAAVDAALARAVPEALEASARSAAEAAISRLAPSAVDRRLSESMKASLDAALKKLHEAAEARVEAELETRCGPRVEAAVNEHLSSEAVDARVRETAQTSALTVEPRLVQAAEESARRTATWVADTAAAKFSETMTRRALPQWIGLGVALLLGIVALVR